MLSPNYEATYDLLLQHLGARCDALPASVCLHWPMHQPAYLGRLLVVGQALNGWTVEGSTRDLVHPDVRVSLLEWTRACSENERAFCWMSPRVWSRPFWKLARVAMDHLDLSPEQIAWSNLAKVAPAAGKNPGNQLLAGQLTLGGRLLHQEVEELDPELVLIISGRAFAEPFLTGAGYEPDWLRRGSLQFDGRLDGRRWIVVSHPGTFSYRFEASRAALTEALEGARSGR